MNTVDQIRNGLVRAWDSVAEGWHEFRDLAGDALTRFRPKITRGDVESADDRLVHRASRWGLLAAEVADHDDAIQVMIEVPGLSASDFDLEIRGDLLIVRGEKKISREEKRGHYHVMERAYGHFERAIRLPVSVEEEGAKATYDAGVLTISLPKSNRIQSRRITVDAR